MSKKVVVVTGANRGIGLALVGAMRNCSKFKDATIFATSRDTSKGDEAIATLQTDLGTDCAVKIRSHQLDICDQVSVDAFAEHLKKEHDGLDVLVNNAGVAFSNNSTVPFSEQAQATMATNYYGTKRICDALFPHLRPGARVVNVTSNCGHLSKIKGHEPEASSLRSRLSSNTLTEEDLTAMMNDFVSLAEKQEHVAAGWPDSAYKVSKVGVSALSRIQQRKMDTKRPGDDIVVNHAHPGWCATAMTKFKGHWPAEKGVTSLLWAATLEPGIAVKGEYIWEDASITSWTEEQVDLFY